ncbi:MAG: hypothetical protein M3362_02315 [Acidobacteriota bacterium]|nr:hypothetical protein [Acidobacteriota bacterium]
MSLAGAKLIELNEAAFVDLDGAIERWQHFPPSSISHHGRRCCRVAREWIFSTDYSQLNGENFLAGPRWLRHKFTWGPSPWPIRWCELVERKTLDCGALAALALEVFAARGVRSFPAQFIQRFSENATQHWTCKWRDEGNSVHWVKEDLIYHEGCAIIVRDNEIKIWDSSAGWWVNTNQRGGYGSLLALRVFATQSDAPAELLWGGQRIRPNEWQRIERRDLVLL